MSQLGELERVIMEYLWEWGRPASVREVVDVLVGKRDVAYTTVMTIMERLHRKQYLSRKMVGKAYLYEATSTRSAYTARLMREALATNPDRQGALIHFVDEMSADEVQALRRAVSRARARDQER